MHAAMARGARAYYQTHVQTSTPLERVVALYDGALRFMRTAMDAMRRGDRVAKADAMSRGVAIVAELQNTLNMAAGGDVARALDRLYGQLLQKLVQATATNNPAGLEGCIELLAPIRAAWATIAAANPAPPAAEAP